MMELPPLPGTPRRRHDRLNEVFRVGERLESLLQGLARTASRRGAPLGPLPQNKEKQTGNVGASAWVDPVDPRHLVELWRNWEMVMGSALAPLAFPLGRRGDLLIVGGEDNMALQELSYQTPEILERVNAFMDAPPDAPVFTRVDLRLLMGLPPLSLPPEAPRQERPAPPRPVDLGAYFSSMRPDSPVTRAYAACLRLHGLLE